MLRAISRGELSTATRVVDVLPEFAGTDRFRRARKDRITVGHLLTHRSGLPLTPTPYAAMGERLGLSEDEVIARVGALKQARVLRQVSAIFDTRKSSLVECGCPLHLPPLSANLLVTRDKHNKHANRQQDPPSRDNMQASG